GRVSHGRARGPDPRRDDALSGARRVRLWTRPWRRPDRAGVRAGVRRQLDGSSRSGARRRRRAVPDPGRLDRRRAGVADRAVARADFPAAAVVRRVRRPAGRRLGPFGRLGRWRWWRVRGWVRRIRGWWGVLRWGSGGAGRIWIRGC